MILNRKDVRKHFTELLREQLPRQYTLLPYRKIRLQGLSPVILVSSGSSMRKLVRQQVTSASISLYVFSVVLHTAEDESWTEDLAEDQLDDIEAAVARTCELNQRTAYWESIGYSHGTTIERFEVSGGPYLVEVFSITMEVR